MRRYLKLLCAVMLTLSAYTGFAQDPTDSLPGDPGALAVSTAQNMKFGAFSLGSGGGNIIVSNSGARSLTGNVILLNLGFIFCQAIFDVEAPEGTIISILTGPDITLNGSNGGTMTLHLGSTNPASPFSSAVLPPNRTSVHLGGTLTAGDPSVAVAGNYSGTFSITFNNE